MKHLLALLSAAFLLVGCTGSDSVSDSAIAPNDSSEDSPSTQTEGSVADDTAETSEDDLVDEGELDSEAADLDESESEGEGEADIAGLEQTNVKLVVKNQMTAGQIVVETVATSRDGWVSVHKSQSDGSILLPEGIGEARVDSGDSEDVIIDLWEAPAIDEKLWVLLHIDAGDRGEYEFPGEDQAVQKNGEIMARSFTIKDLDPDEDEDEDETAE